MASLKSYGEWALVTGASAGIGAAFARKLAAQSVNVVLVARRADRLEALAAELRERHGVKTRVVPEDLERDGAAERLLEWVRDLEIGILVNNAGFSTVGRFERVAREKILGMIRVNCLAVAALTHAFLPAMQARRRGAVIIVSSVAGYQPLGFAATYGATKAFDLMLGEALWADNPGGALPEGGRAAPGGLPPADGGRAGRRHRALPAVDRAPPHRRGAHLPRLDLQLPGAARGRDRAVQGGDRGRCRLRQSVQRHRLVPDQARASRRGNSLARIRDQGAALRAAPLPALQPGPGLLGAGAAGEGGERVRARARDRAGVSVRARGAGGDPQAAELDRHGCRAVFRLKARFGAGEHERLAVSSPHAARP